MAEGSSSPGGNPFDEIEADLASAWDGLGEKIVADVQQRLSVPVQYVEVPFQQGGQHAKLATASGKNYRVIRSRPGEPPRMETKRLKFSIIHRIEVSGHTVTLLVDSQGVDYAERLQEQMRRIIFNDVPDQYGTEAESAAAAIV